MPWCPPTTCMVVEVGAPTEKRRCSTAWLDTTATASRAVETVRPASSTHVGRASAAATTRPTAPGTGPPPARCDSIDTRMAKAAVTAPRTTRVPRPAIAGVSAPLIWATA
ncbi:hypothetical protein BFL35_01780 [Clavibacter michiganensis]|nr:hypothetical protein BFL35_01780 [Clavibacter michiganensis]